MQQWTLDRFKVTAADDHLVVEKVIVCFYSVYMWNIVRLVNSGFSRKKLYCRNRKLCFKLSMSELN